ncbi:hypothetical protein ACIBKX_21680 [Streptomyces sp. NPDC050658]|uniref:hypothetical protein n=1 Tax=unclassified Streptomyces TaxID=2593676 RepID=UPI00343F1233
MRRGVRNVAAALCLGGLVSACGSAGEGRVATGAAAASPERAAGTGVAPTGDVEIVPLDEAPAKSPDPKGSGSEAPEKADGPDGGAPSGARSSGAKSPGGKDGSGSPATAGGSPPASGGDNSSRTEGPSASPDPSAPGSAEPSGPAKLSFGEPELKPADERWCEKVGVTFRNTGGTAVRSGRVTFETHVIGALGVDWATLESTEKLPAPIGAGKSVTKSWNVCVDAWRVPLGMHVETRDVSVEWK